MAVKNLYGVWGQLTSGISSVATIIPVDASLAGAIVASGFVNGTDETYFAIKSANLYEVVKVTAVNGQNLTVVRGVDSVAKAFPMGATLEHVVTAQAILATIGPITSTVQITGGGIAAVTNPSGNNWNVTVPAPAFSGTGGVEITGAWPNLAFNFVPNDCCGDEEGAGTVGITSMEGSGIATAYAAAGVGYVAVTPPNFTGVGVTITGAWPNYTFTVAGGTAGTVTSVSVGGGLTLTGSPTLNPTISITNTGVVAGTYGGVGINSRGQITAVPVGFNPLSTIVTNLPLTHVRAGAQDTLSINAAAIGAAGVVPLVDHTDPFNPADTTSAMTPAATQVALATVNTPSVAGASTYSGEADAAYTNTISGSATAIDIPAGRKCIVYAEVTMLDGVDPTLAIEFGLAVFNSTPAKVKSNRKVTQCTQSMSFVLDGPLNTTLSIVTTAIPAGASVISSSLWAEKV